MKRTFWGALALLPVLSAAAQPVDYPITAELVGRWDGFDRRYADIWGDGQYAYLCHFGDAGLDIIDVGDPFHPVRVAEVRPDPPNDFTSSQDAQVGDGMLFVALDYDGIDGVLIVDVRDPLHPVNKTLVTIPNFSDVHNVFYEGRMLYLANSRTPQIGIVDLRSYNLDNAPERIIEPLWTINDVGNSFVHDITVKGGKLFACAWNGGLWVYDATPVSRRIPPLLGTTTGVAVHSCWATDDGRYVVSGEERGGGGISVYQITPPGPIGIGLLQFRAGLVLPFQDAYSVHNQLIAGNRLYDAWYQAGLLVHDINPVTGSLTPVARYDTFEKPGDFFDGAWGVYPFLGDDRILVSDIDGGLFVIDVTGVPKLDLPDGLPPAVNPVVSTSFRVRVLHERALASKESVALNLQIGGGTRHVIALTPLGSGMYQAVLPPIPCGAEADFYISAQTAGGQTTYLPVGAPSESYSLPSLTGYLATIQDDFENALGWTAGDAVDTATRGLWVRGNPIGTTAQPENDDPLEDGTQCWFTGQGPIQGISNLNDVDGGKTTLTSPVFSVSGTDAFLEFSWWFSNHLGGSPAGDTLISWISDDGGLHWVPLDVLAASTQSWVRVHFRVSDYVTPGPNMRVKFVATDGGGDSLVEAAIDHFVVFDGPCREVVGDANGDGSLDLLDFMGWPACVTGPGGVRGPGCVPYDLDHDGDVDLADLAGFQNALDIPS